MSGSHTSAGRSVIPSGMTGHDSVTCSRTESAHLASRSRRAWPCFSWVRSRQGWHDSLGARLRIRMITDRVKTVSGSDPSPARATAQKAGNPWTVWLAPSPTHRYIIRPRRCPAFRNPRRASFSPALGPKTVSISSKMIVGRCPSTPATDRNSADGEASTAAIALGTRVSITSRARLLPDPGSGDRNAIRGVESKQSSRCAWASHNTTATYAASRGKMLKRRWKASTSSSSAAPSMGVAGVVGSLISGFPFLRGDVRADGSVVCVTCFKGADGAQAGRVFVPGAAFAPRVGPRGTPEGGAHVQHSDDAAPVARVRVRAKSRRDALTGDDLRRATAGRGGGRFGGADAGGGG